MLVLSLGFMWPGIRDYAATGQLQLHWSRLIAASFSFLCFIQTGVFAILLSVISLWHQERNSSIEIEMGFPLVESQRLPAAQ